MKKRIFSLLLLSCTVLNVFSMNACAILDTKDDLREIPVNGSMENSYAEESVSTDFELLPPPEAKSAIIRMIQPVGTLEGWQSGKTIYSANFYIDDMMNVLDELKWQKGSDDMELSEDFHFKINLYRSPSELEVYSYFYDPHRDETEHATETQEPDAALSEVTDNIFGKEDLAVQYLINYDDGTVNMRLSDYSAQTFDIYAKLNENEMRILVLCLKYYFGPQQ